MKKWMVIGANFLVATACFANMNKSESDEMLHGIFLGIGADYNSLNLTQKSWGRGVGNIQTSTGSNSNGVGEGSGAPFNNTTQMFSPGIQVGYFRHFQDSQNLYGFKLSYQYLNSTATNSNLYIPQLGTITSKTGTVSSLFGWVNADSVQASTTHEVTFLAFLGKSFDNKYFYLGLGPSFFNVQSKNYYSIGYAEFEGATVNVTGLVSYSSPSLWLLGGAAQLGMSYFISPTWFIDASYTYTITGSRTVNHQQTYSNTSQIDTTTYNSTGTLYTKNTLRVNNQSVRFTINKLFDL